MIPLTTHQVANLLGQSESAIRHLEQQGLMPPAERINVRGDRRWRLRTILDFQQTQATSATCPACGYKGGRGGCDYSISQLREFVQIFLENYGWVSPDLLVRRLRIPRHWAEVLAEEAGHAA